MTDSILTDGVEGLLKMQTVDLSENPKITSKGWKHFSSNISAESSLQHLIYQQGTVTEASAAALSELLPFLTELDLSQCKFEGGSLQNVLKKMQDLDELSKMKIKKILLNRCSLNKQDKDRIEAINKNYEGESLIIHDM